jgi:hypothetical protein
VTLDTNTLDNACPVTAATGGSSGGGMSGFVPNGSGELSAVPEPNLLLAPLGFCVAGLALIKMRKRAKAGASKI